MVKDPEVIENGCHVGMVLAVNPLPDVERLSERGLGTVVFHEVPVQLSLVAQGDGRGHVPFAEELFLKKGRSFEIAHGRCEILASKRQPAQVIEGEHHSGRFPAGISCLNGERPFEQGLGRVESALVQIETSLIVEGTGHFEMAGAHPHDIGTIVDRAGVAIRAGHHCAQPVMERFGVSATARASFALYNTRAEIDALADALERVREIFA